MKSIFYNGSNFVKLNLRDDFSVGKSFHVLFLVCDVSLGNNDAMQLKEGKD